MSLFERIKNKRLSLQEKKEDKTDKSVKQSEVSKQAKKFTKKINRKNINRPEGIIGDTYVSTDKKGNIRSAKKVNPTLKKTVSQVKSDIEFKQSLQKVRKFAGQKGTGELSDKAPEKVRKFVKDTRAQKIKDLKLPDTSFDAKDKFSQKGFEKTLKKYTKGPRTGIVDPSKKYAITKGQANVKGLESKAFKKTKPSDIKLPNTFKNFSTKLRRLKSDIQDVKDKDIATMRTGKSSSKVKVSGADNLTRQDVGMAPPDTRSKAQKFTDKINTAKASKNTMSSGKNFINKYKKQAETATTNLRKQVDTIAKNPTLTGGEKAKQSREVMKKVKTAQNFARGYKNNPSSAVVRTSDLNTVTSAAKGSIVKPKPYTGVTAKGNPSRAINPFAKITSQATIKDIAKQKGNLRQLKNYRYYAGAKKIAAKSPIAKKAIVGAGKILGRLGTRGRIAAGALSFIPTLAANPGVRSFVKNTALFGGLAAITGLAKPKQNVLKVGKGVTKTTNLPSKFQPKNAKNLSYVDSYGKKRKLESGDVRFKFGLTGTKPGGKPGGMQYNKQDMARVKNIQKKYIDSYNASVKGNPFKKQIKYSVNKDGSYTVTPPKKK